MRKPVSRGLKGHGRAVTSGVVYELSPDGPDATIVTEVYDCSRAPEDERASMADGAVWLAAMAATLGRLDHMCTGGPAAGVG